MTVLDAHVHLWDLAVRPQPWTAQFPVLQRSFLLPDLERALDDYGTDAAVVVQAGDTTGETLDLLALAGTTPRLAGVVGWVDLDGPDVRGSLAALHAAPGGDKLVAVRHQLQVEADPRYLARPGVRNGLTAVAEAGLAFDVVVSPWQLPLATETAAALPGVRFVLDHAGKPPIASGDLRAWRADLARPGAPLLAACAQRGVDVVAAAPFNSGLLAEDQPSPTAHFNYGRPSREALDQARTLAQICERHGTRLPAAALQFPLRHPAVASVVAGLRTAGEVNAAVRLLSEPVPEAAWAELAARPLE